MGFELFDKPNWAGSDFSEKVNYQRALEGELERTLQIMSDVEAARVHLVMPARSIFSEANAGEGGGDLKLATAQLPDRLRQPFAQLVASAVDRLARPKPSVDRRRHTLQRGAAEHPRPRTLHLGRRN